jgi:hypothetical protein
MTHTVPAHDRLWDRVIADSSNPDAWHAARVGRIGASDAAKFSKLESAELYARAKLNTSFTGNASTALGHQWEVAALAAAGWGQNTFMFVDATEDGFMATPDGLRWVDGLPVLAEMKLTSKPKRTIPLGHKRQMWWQQMVCGAQQTAYMEMPYDEDGHPIGLEPNLTWFDRDDSEIQKLLVIAHPVLRILRATLSMQKDFSS